jgi:hypothetical protein
MDMTDMATRRGAVELGTVLMIAAFAVFGGFLYWLTGQAQAERALDLLEDTASVMVDEYADAIPVGAADIMLDASPYEGQLVRLEPQLVLSSVGQQGYMIELPTGPFLVSLSDELLAANLEIVAQQSVIRVTGTVTAMTPEIAAGWQEAGRLSEGERLVAEFAVYFIAAEEVEVSTPAPAADGA